MSNPRRKAVARPAQPYVRTDEAVWPSLNSQHSLHFSPYLCVAPRSFARCMAGAARTLVTLSVTLSLAGACVGLQEFL